MSEFEPSDEDLVRRARAGEEAAVQALFDRWLPRLRRRVRQNLRGVVRRRVAESDVIQEAYLTAFLKMDDFEDRGDGSFGRWLSKILEHKLRDQVRQHIGTGMRDARLEVAHPDGASGDVAQAAYGSPSAEAMGVEQREALRRALAELPEDYRTALRLVHEERLPLSEVGGRMHRSANAAGKIYARAVKELGRRLQAPRTP